jgi:tripartite-type tricarboxylate transporter receptor subunit TctC
MGTNATHGTNQFLYDTVPFDAEKDFEPVILIGSFPMVIAANPSFPGNSIADVIATASPRRSQRTSRCRAPRRASCSSC